MRNVAGNFEVDKKHKRMYIRGVRFGGKRGCGILDNGEERKEEYNGRSKNKKK